MGAEDLTGRVFGKLKVIERLENDKKGNPIWLCECKCGNKKGIRGSSLRDGSSKTCGCGKLECEDLKGLTFNKLTVIEKVNKNGRGIWLCRCDCGNEVIVGATSLKTGNTKSCGCGKIKHNQSNSKLYKILSGMIQRCTNKNLYAYKNYGGRGITVCDEWIIKENGKGFSNFYNWAIENGYQEGLSIDRINVDGNYEPSNCRWVTMKVQQNNRSNNAYIEVDGLTLTQSQWSEKLGVDKTTIKNHRKGGDIEEYIRKKLISC